MAKNLGLLNPALTGSTISLDRRSNSSLNVIDNAMYLDEDSGNPYNTLQRNDNRQVNPRPKRTQNAVYDDIYNPRVVGQNQSRTSQTPKKPGRGRQRKNGRIFRVVLMFLIVLVAIIALLLVLLLMMGKVGPKCRCRTSNSGTSPKVGRQSSEEQNKQNETETSSKNTFNTDFSPFYDILEDLQANISSLRQEAESLLQQSEGNTDTLLAAKTKFNFTRHEITLFYNTFYAVVNNVNNSLQQFSHDNALVSGQLQALNTTFTNELGEMKQTYQQYNDIIDDAIQNVNDTIAEKVSIRIAEPGPTGEKGQNGFRGPTGDTGPPGPKGPMGIQGITGAKGDKGMKGDPGFPGKNGNKGASGEKGIKGLQGDTGPPGIKGDTGDPGPRGIGNFSWCQPKKIEQTSPASIDDTQNTKVIGAYCTTTTADAESNLQVLIQSPPNHNTYSCVCRVSGGNPHCALHYWACPIHAP
ncbi:unnamed protein product [Porites evermanni]|uniref:Uncharacterized protein n=1 Tax=Porites evermanni TaxID=104178 RepID=A0ABN8M320_9CNID|nr:unnamed protein product [Porites evermanni]